MDGPLPKAFLWDRDNRPPQASDSAAESIKSAEQVLDVMEFVHHLEQSWSRLMWSRMGHLPSHSVFEI